MALWSRTRFGVDARMRSSRPGLAVALLANDLEVAKPDFTRRRVRSA